MPRVETFDFEVEGTPEEVSERLRQRTRMQLMPSQGRMIKLGDTPLAGVIRGDRFTVALNQADVWRRLRAVATGQLRAVPGGTRVVGQSGVSAFWTWYLRLAWVFGVATLGGALLVALSSTSHEVLGFAVAFLSIAFLGLTRGVGLHVRHAGEQARALAESVRRNLGGGIWPMMAGSESVESASRVTATSIAPVNGVAAEPVDQPT